MIKDNFLHNGNDTDNDNDFISSQNSTVCSVDLTIKILQKRIIFKTVQHNNITHI